MKRIIILVYLWCLPLLATAQLIDPTRFDGVLVYLNPAYVGSANAHRGSMLFRKPLDGNLPGGILDATQTVLAGDGIIETNSNSTFNVGLGGYFSHTSTRFDDGTQLSTNRLSFGTGGNNEIIAWGIQGVLSNYALATGNSLVYFDQLGSYGALIQPTTGDLYANNTFSDWQMDMNVGALFYPTNNFLLGLSCHNCIQYVFNDSIESYYSVNQPRAQVTANFLYNFEYGVLTGQISHRKDNFVFGDITAVYNHNDLVWIGGNIKMRNYSLAGGSAFLTPSAILRFKTDFLTSSRSKTSPFIVDIAFDIFKKPIAWKQANTPILLNQGIELTISYVHKASRYGKGVCPDYNRVMQGKKSGGHGYDKRYKRHKTKY